MAGDCSTRKSGNAIPFLGDITNREVRRGFSSILRTPVLKSKHGHDRGSNDEEGDSQPVKKPNIGGQNMPGEGIRTKCTETGNVKDVAMRMGKRESSRMFTNLLPASDSLDSGVHSAGGDAIVHGSVEVGDASRDSCLSSSFMPEGSQCSDRDSYVAAGKCSSGVRSNACCEVLTSPVCKNGRDGLSVACLASEKDGAAEFSGSTKQQGSRRFDLERCKALKSKNCSNLNAGVESIKNCLCSFCTKAAFMWADLHYQDIKGRIAALRKSQKEAAILVQKNCRNKDIESHGHGNLDKSSNLECDLMGLWKSLSVRTEEILVRECNKFQADFLELRDLRDNCKTHLELIDGVPPDRPKSASDASCD